MSDYTPSPVDEGELLERTDKKVKPPEMYKVVLLNDDYTPRDFVTEILMQVFHKSREDAGRIMLSAHTAGKAVVGLYTYDIATTKVTQAHKLAKEFEFPLKLVVEGA